MNNGDECGLEDEKGRTGLIAARGVPGIVGIRGCGRYRVIRVTIIIRESVVKLVTVSGDVFEVSSTDRHPMALAEHRHREVSG